MYSNKAAVTQQEEGEKSLAEAAFDGSNPENMGPTIADGATIAQVASELSKGLQIDPPSIDNPEATPDEDDGPTLEERIQMEAELAKLQKKLTILKWATAIGALIFSILIAVIKDIAGYGTLVAGIITAVAALLLVGMGLWMKNIVDQMADPKFKYVNQTINFKGEYNTVLAVSLLSAALVAAGWTSMWKNAWNSIQSFFKGGAGAGANGGFSVKTGFKAAKTANDAASGFRLRNLFSFKKWLNTIFPSKD